VRKILSLEELLVVRERLRAQGKTMVFTNGIFDLLHVGHVRYLQEAKALGEVLIVGLNSDASTRALKGPKRPLIPQRERAELLAALEVVDYVVLFEELTAERLVTALQPEIYAKGGDWSLEALPEAGAVADYGGRIEILPQVPGRSTQVLIKTIVERYGKG
jgi:rfaE bifunctional protein nucleotidyltransferase chain/domain